MTHRAQEEGVRHAFWGYLGKHQRQQRRSMGARGLTVASVARTWCARGSRFRIGKCESFWGDAGVQTLFLVVSYLVPG